MVNKNITSVIVIMMLVMLMSVSGIIAQEAFVTAEEPTFFEIIFSFFRAEFTIVGQDLGASQYADETWDNVQAGTTFNKYANSYCGSGHGLFNVYVDNWVPRFEMKDHGFFNCGPNNNKCIVELYCMPEDFCNSDYDCSSNEECYTKNAVDPYMPLIDASTGNTINSYSYCKETEGCTGSIDCWRIGSSDTCEKNTYDCNYVTYPNCPSTWHYTSLSSCQADLDKDCSYLGLIGNNCAPGHIGCASGSSVHKCNYMSSIDKYCYEVIETCSSTEKCVDGDCVLESSCADLNDACSSDSDCCDNDLLEISCQNNKCTWDDVSATCSGQGGTILSDNYVCDGEIVEHDNPPFICCVGDSHYVGENGGAECAAQSGTTECKNNEGTLWIDCPTDWEDIGNHDCASGFSCCRLEEGNGNGNGDENGEVGEAKTFTWTEYYSMDDEKFTKGDYLCSSTSQCPLKEGFTVSCVDNEDFAERIYDYSYEKCDESAGWWNELISISLRISTLNLIKGDFCNGYTFFKEKWDSLVGKPKDFCLAESDAWYGGLWETALKTVGGMGLPTQYVMIITIMILITIIGMGVRMFT